MRNSRFRIAKFRNRAKIFSSFFATSDNLLQRRKNITRAQRCVCDFLRLPLQAALLLGSLRAGKIR